MDIPQLPESWEKRALIVVGVIFVVTVIYAFGPFSFQTAPANDTLNQTSPQTITPIPFPQKAASANNTTNGSNSTNSTQISAEQAKNIAAQMNPGYAIGQPTQQSLSVNGTTYSVWAVPLSQNGISKTIYIDINTGIIVQ